MLRRTMTLTCSEIILRNRSGHSSSGSSSSSARNWPAPELILPASRAGLGERRALGEGRQPRGAGNGGVAAVGAVMAQQRFERVAALVRRDGDVRARRRGGRHVRSRPTRPTRSRWQAGPDSDATWRTRPANCWPRHRRPAPASRPVPPPRRSSRTSPTAARRRLWRAVQVPRTVNLWCPITFHQVIGDVGQDGVLDHPCGVQHSAHREPGRGRGGDQPPRGVGFGDVAALDDDVGAGRAHRLDLLE